MALRPPNPAKDLVINQPGAGAALVVQNFREFQREVALLGPAFRGSVGRANKAFAQVVADDASEEARSRGSVFAHVVRAAGFKARGTAKSGRVEMKHPAAAGAEFGAKRFRQFLPWVGRNQYFTAAPETGYMVGAVLGDHGEEYIKAYMDTLVAATRGAFPRAI